VEDPVVDHTVEVVVLAVVEEVEEVKITKIRV